MAIVLDVETTGLIAGKDRIVEIAIVSFESDDFHYSTRINPEVPIPPEVTAIHGISNEDVVDSPTFAQVSNYVRGWIENSDAIIGHNPYFDKGMIAGEFKRVGIHVNFPILICTKRMWDIYEPREKRHLQNAYKRFVDYNGFDGAHGALADTLAAKSVLQSQIEAFKLTGKSWQEFDPDFKVRWGPSEHVVIVEDVLIFNVGKNKGIACHMIEKSFWKWLSNKDFPEHVKVLADYLTIVRPNASAQELFTWAYGAMP